MTPQYCSVGASWAAAGEGSASAAEAFAVAAVTGDAAGAAVVNAAVVVKAFSVGYASSVVTG